MQLDDTEVYNINIMLHLLQVYLLVVTVSGTKILILLYISMSEMEVSCRKTNMRHIILLSKRGIEEYRRRCKAIS